MERVKLIKTESPDKLPIGTLGTLIEGSLEVRGMVVVLWDTGHEIPMYRDEIEPC